MLNLTSVGLGSSLGCPVSWESFRLRNDWLRGMGGVLDHVGGVLDCVD